MCGDKARASVQGGRAHACVQHLLPSVTLPFVIVDLLLQVEPTGLSQGPASPAVSFVALFTSCIYFYFALLVSPVVYLLHVTIRHRRAGSLSVICHDFAVSLAPTAAPGK